MSGGLCVPAQSPRCGLRPAVLHVVQPVDGGVAQVVSDLVADQVGAGLTAAVACPASGALADAVRALGADVHPWRARRAPGPLLPLEIRQLAGVLERVRPQVVHAHGVRAGLAARFALRGRIPTVFQPHIWSFEAVGGVTAWLARRWERYGARWADQVVCVSEAEQRAGERAGIDARWTVIPNGVDTRRFRPSAEDRPRALPPLVADLPESAPLVVCVGRLCRQKGQDMLLAAWEHVLRRLPNACLVLVGDGPDAEELRANAPASVRFAGAAPDVASWYRAADLVVLPSRWEGMALPPLEAMACGRPVVVTDVGGARESLPPGHALFCLTPSRDPYALATAVADLLLNAPLRATLGRQGHQHVLSAHDVRHAAGAVADVYREVAGVDPVRRRKPLVR
ncbi:glycosyltransferase [Streptomyces formicae]|uniref:Glycosyltransferase n=1 Tax=Streptomyces formicae TaxID=1616117 RepID=A0ABY3WF19_9ACTN|nr:glycosyltransferase [Streptomyces formicae]UNM10241.1 glycosyltransferase [Streptomyces formicae]